LVRLPDATELLGGSMQEGTSNNSTGDHASRVATAMATSRKRPQLNGGAHALHSTKFPRRNITPSGTTMSSTGGVLVPPQIRGRSVSLHPQKQFLTDQYPEQNLMHWGIKFSVLFQTIKLEEGFLLGRILLKVSYSPPYPGGSQFSSLSSLQVYQSKALWIILLWGECIQQRLSFLTL